MSEWLDWDGGECPVDRNARVDWKIRTGRTIRWKDYDYKAGDLDWSHLGNGSDIIAYRITS